MYLKKNLNLILKVEFEQRGKNLANFALIKNCTTFRKLNTNIRVVRNGELSQTVLPVIFALVWLQLKYGDTHENRIFGRETHHENIQMIRSIWLTIVTEYWAAQL